MTMQVAESVLPEPPVVETPQAPPRQETNDATEESLFSPRSTAAMALSSICQQGTGNPGPGATRNLSNASMSQPSSNRSSRSSPTDVLTNDTVNDDDKPKEKPKDADTASQKKATTTPAPVPDPLLQKIRQDGPPSRPPPPIMMMYPPPNYPPMSWPNPPTWQTPHQKPVPMNMLPPLQPYAAWGEGQLHPNLKNNVKSAAKTRPPPHAMHSMVTPTPNKKQRQDANYSRKTKSLSVLAETFLKKHEGYPRGSDIIIDQLAKELGVERRRIYDVVNILESVRLVIKKAKNTYQWMGTEHLPSMFAILQHEAILEYPIDAVKNGLVLQEPSKEDIEKAQAKMRNPRKGEDNNKNKTLSRLSQQFLQVFLVGHTTISLPEASDKINGGSTSPRDLAALGTPANQPIPTDPRKFQQAATRGLKTKIRRLYDIANVFASIGLLVKVDDKNFTDIYKRPRYSWAFRVSLNEFGEIYKKLPEQMKEKQTPFATMPETTTTNTAPASIAKQQPPMHVLPTPPTQVLPLQPTPHRHAASNWVAAETPNAILANIHQTGGAVWPSAEKQQQDPRRVSLPERAEV